MDAMSLPLELEEHKEQKERLYTWDDILALPEGKRAELIDGHWFDMATPNTRHQRLVALLTHKLMDYIEKNGGSCQVLPSPYAVFLTESNRNWLEPDVSVVCDPDKLKEDGCHGAPDLVVEIVSPSTIKRDMGIKLFKYRTEGVREYWVINPEKRIVNAYRFDDDVEKIEGDLISFDDELESHIFPDFTIRLGDFL